MTNQNAITLTNSQMPTMSIVQAVERYNALVEFTKTVMKSGKDYGIVPGTDKPTLLKPGAEKLCTLFGFSPEFEIADKVVDFKGGLFYFQYRCMLVREGQIVATGLGSCNSMEKKYRYRNVTEKKATQDEKDRAIRVENKSGSYGNYRVYVLENTEPYDLINTIDKMAQKRALVAAILIGANASEFYTQDVEDMGYIEGDYREIGEDKPAEPNGKKAEKVVQKAPVKTEAKQGNGNGNGHKPAVVDRPVMSLDMAESETSSDGTQYGIIDSETLSNKVYGINKMLAKPDLTPEKREEYQRKKDAIATILKYRAETEVQPA